MTRTGVLNSKLIYVDDFEKAYIDLEKSLAVENKKLLRKICLSFDDLADALEHKEPGIFKIVIKWFRLYLNLHIAIDPSNEKFLNQFEKTIPTAISYIIGCLQYKTNEIPNYHFRLLNIIEELLENVKPCIIKEIVKLETGTIASLWNPIDYAGDFNTQFKALKILALFLKHLDTEKQNEELKSIKWTNLNLFYDKLKTIVQETKTGNILENATRELLNNYNMNLSKSKTVYSFYCKSLILGNKFNFYQLLNMDEFWIDINSCPKTLSFNGRFKLHSRSKTEIITVIVKVQKIKLENNDLLIHFCQPQFSKYSQHFSTISERVIKFTLSQEEVERLRKNNFVLDYFNHAQNENNSSEFSDNEEAVNNKYGDIDPLELTPPLTWTDSPKTSRINHEGLAKRPRRSETLKKINDSLQTHPIRNLQSKRKFFSSHLEEVKSEEEKKKGSKKRPLTRKPRSTKPNKRQVGKVLPTADLTQNSAQNKVILVDITNNLNNGFEKRIPTTSSNGLTPQKCSQILKNVSDIYDVGDTTYAEPCQSYHTFKTKPISRPVGNVINKKCTNRKDRKQKLDAENEMTKKSVGVRKRNRDNISSNKENRVFDSQSSCEVPPMEIDLTFDSDCGPYKKLQRNENENKINLPLDISGLEVLRTCEQSTKKPTPYCSPNNYTTPTTKDFNNMDVENSIQPDVVDEFLKDCNTNVDNIHTIHEVENNGNVVTTNLNINVEVENKQKKFKSVSNNLELNNLDENVYLGESVVLQTRNDLEESDSSDNDENNCKNLIKPSINFLKGLDFIINDDIVIMRNISSNRNQNPYNEELMWNNPDRNCTIIRNVSTKTATDGQVTPNTVIKRQTHVCTKEAVVVADIKQKTSYTNLKARKALINFYNKAAIIHQDIAPENEILPIDDNNNTIVVNENMSNALIPIDRNNCNSNETNENQMGSSQLAIKNIEDINLNISLRRKESQNNIHTALIPSNNKNLIATNKKHSNKFNQMIPSTLAIEYVEEDNLNSSLITKAGQDNNITALIPMKNKNLIATNKNMLNKINEKQMDSLSASIKDITFAPLVSSTLQSPNIDNITESELKINTERGLSLQDIENANNFISTSPTLDKALQYGQELFENDLSKLVNDYEAKIKHRFENARRRYTTNTADMYKHKVCQITESMLQKSEQLKTELELLHKNIDCLVTQMEWQYQKFVQKSKEFDNSQEIMKQALDALQKFDIKNQITTEYKDLMNQLNLDKGDVIQEVWNNYMDERTQKFNSSMEKLSKI